MDLRQNVVELRGAVTRPGSYDLGDSLKLSELIDNADGVLGDVYLERVDIVRIKPDFTEELIKLDLGQALEGDLDNDIYLQGLDRVRVYGMSEMILNTPSATPNVRPKDFSGHSFEALRKMTLENLQKASALYTTMASNDFESAKVIFLMGEKQFDFPFWNLLNGMLSDCVYHTGQIVLMRRANGNPQNPNVNVFLGKTRE